VPEKQDILNSIAALAKRLGHSPSLVEFVAHTGTCKHSVFRLFPKWNEAVRAAGLEPRRLYVRPRDEELLEDWGKGARRKGGLLTRSAYRIEGRYYARTLEKRFGGWTSLPEAFRKFAKGKRKWADVLALLPNTLPEKERAAMERRCLDFYPVEQSSARFVERPCYLRKSSRLTMFAP